MNNKVLIKLIVPEIDNSYDLFIPVNEVIWKVKKLMIKCISDLANVEINITQNYILINKVNGTVYDNNQIIINTDIRNATELVLMTEKS